MITAGVILVLLGVSGGVPMGIWWCIHTVHATKITHKAEMDEIFVEVKRLRAQVALHINSGATVLESAQRSQEEQNGAGRDRKALDARRAP